MARNGNAQKQGKDYGNYISECSAKSKYSITDHYIASL